MGLIIISVLVDAVGSLLLFRQGDIRYIFPLACAVLGAIGAVLIAIGMQIPISRAAWRSTGPSRRSSSVAT